MILVDFTTPNNILYKEYMLNYCELFEILAIV